MIIAFCEYIKIYLSILLLAIWITFSCVAIMSNVVMQHTVEVFLCTQILIFLVKMLLNGLIWQMQIVLKMGLCYFTVSYGILDIQLFHILADILQTLSVL